MRKLADSGARTLITTDLPGVLPQAVQAWQRGRLRAADRGATTAQWGEPSAGLAVPEAAIDWAALDGAARAWPAADAGRPGAAAIYRRHHRAAAGGDADPRQPDQRGRASTTAWNRGIGRALGRGDRIMGVLPLFHIYALTDGDAARVRSGRRDDAAAAFRRRRGAGRHRAGALHAFLPACRRCGSRWSTIPGIGRARPLQPARVQLRRGRRCRAEVAARVRAS